MTNNSSPCKCNTCGVAANSINGTRHRRCKARVRGMWITVALGWGE